METIEGEIQNIKSNRKALAINNVWYNSFKEISEEFNKGSFVKISYYKKGDFNNIKAIEMIIIDNNIIKSNELTNTDKNCILLCAKDLYLANRDRSLQEYIKEIKNIRLNL